jgi:nucleoside-diphosphate-sugar epimerase
VHVTRPAPTSIEELEDLLSRPVDGVLGALERTPGDIIVLGAAGKMGPSLSRMARRALDELGRTDRVIAVSRFSNPDAESDLRAAGIHTARCDLTDRQAVAGLPDAPNVIFMAGQKFGTSESPTLTWVTNTVVPAIAAGRYAGSRIVAFSTGNVYPLSPARSRGPRETDPVGPTGEYATSCLGRERVLEFYASRRRSPLAIVRLNYANDLRYGVLTDLASRIISGEPIDLRMGYVNVIWQGDANARALQCLEHAALPPFVINITGAETLSVREVALRLGSLLGKQPELIGTEAPDALLSDASLSMELFGPPDVPTDVLVEWTAAWLRGGGALLGKPTHFETRDGRF